MTLKNVCLLRTRTRSIVDAECSVKCVDSVISWLKWNSFTNSVILLSLFRAILKLKSPAIIMSTMFVL